MNDSDKLQVLIDHVLQAPLVRHVSVDVDGKKTVSFTRAPYPSLPDISVIFGAINAIDLFEFGKIYPKNSIVRFGLVDYFATEDTDEQPPNQPWVLVRVNQKGDTGPPGIDTTY